MTAVEKYFFTPLYAPRSRWAVVRWWESRRLLFNLSVGAAGLVTLGMVSLFARIPPAPRHPGFPWVAVAAYAVMANICYSAGALADLYLRHQLGERAPAVGPVLFRYGFVFSLGLTLLPIPLAALGWVIRLLF